MAESIVSFAVETIGQNSIQEMIFLHGVREKIEEMRTQLKFMQNRLRDADRRANEDERIKDWVSEIKEVAYDAENVLETYALKMALRKKNGVFNSIKRYACLLEEPVILHKIGSEIEEIKSRITNLGTNMEQFGFMVTNEKLGFVNSWKIQWELRRTFSVVEEQFVIGFDSKIKTLVKKLVGHDGNHEIVTICGMGGMGKSTLAKKVYHNEEIRVFFKGFSWVYVSQQFRTIDVMREILKDLIGSNQSANEEIEGMKEGELVKRIYVLLQEKRCLIVVDDVWTIDDWIRLQCLFPKGKTKSKVIITSRNREIGLRVDPNGFICELSCLSDCESWELLENKAFSRANAKDGRDLEMEELGKKMVKHCAGLPLAIIVLGGVLASKQTLEEWRTVDKNIKSYLRIGKGCNEERRGCEVPELLALSYDELPYQLKPCFLYLGHFPEDYEIPVKKLIRLWMAERMISETQCDVGETMEDLGQRYLGRLVNRCMVQVGKMGSCGGIKTCRLHDLMRDMCLMKCRSENFFDVINPQFGIECCSSRRLAIFFDLELFQSFPLQFDRNPHLRSLVCFNNGVSDVGLRWGRQMKSILNKFEMLRVLNLEGMRGVMVGWKLPREIADLIHLRCLCLRECEITKVPSSIGNLQCLQTLDLFNWNQVRLPNVLWKMERLRHLYLPNNCVLKSGRLQLSNLHNLQTLVNPPEGEFHNLFSLQTLGNAPEGKHMKELLKFSSLRKLEIDCLSKISDFEEIFRNRNIMFNHLRSLTLITNETKKLDLAPILLGCPHLRKLFVRGELQVLPEYHQFPQDLTKLTLEVTMLDQDPIPTLEKLPYLKFLYLNRDSFMCKEMVFSKKGFPKLQTLRLWSLSNLEDWRMEEGAMPCLSHLSLWHCKALNRVPNGLRFITTLQELEIRSMSTAFQNKLVEGGEDFCEVQHVPHVEFKSR